MDTTLREDLLPRRIYNRITEITPEELSSLGAAALLLDIDNTLAYDSSYTFFPGVKEWTRRMISAGVPMMILSNTYTLRARSMARRLGLPYLAMAEKPSSRGFKKCAELLGLEPASVAMAGDQLFTDIRGANAAGCIPLLIRPQHTEILFYLRYQKLRKIERRFLAAEGLLPETEAPAENTKRNGMKEGNTDE